MSGRRLEMRRRAISNPQCRRIMPLQHEARDLHFFSSHIRNTHVFITSQHFQHLFYTTIIFMNINYIIQRFNS